MSNRSLTNPPLVEAIFEIRWKLQEQPQGIKMDPHYKLLIGAFYEKLKEAYPFHEQLPTAHMPEEMASYIVQHRFRPGENKWPLVQLGPGIMTVNETESYEAKDFQCRVEQAIEELFSIHFELNGGLNVERMLLRYIDAIPFDYEANNIFSFLKEQMKTEVTLYDDLFEGKRVQEHPPRSLDLRFSFASHTPNGTMHLRFFKGKKADADALIWETMVESAGEDVPKDREGIPAWVSEAHILAEDWFFKLIAGDLERRFE